MWSLATGMARETTVASMKVGMGTAMALKIGGLLHEITSKCRTVISRPIIITTITAVLNRSDRCSRSARIGENSSGCVYFNCRGGRARVVYRGGDYVRHHRTHRFR